MPLSRYLVRNEYGLADPDLYRVADKDDPEALLEGVAMAGLVGVLRQLGDLAEFAAEMFHDLHEEAMATAARGHSLIARVQQLEAEFPSAESTLVSQTTHIPFLYNPGVDWHPSIRMDENLVTQGDMPRFVMDSYEECRGPPRLFLLDKFDVAGAGACLKRYTDPSFFKAESADLITKKSDGPREKRIRKVKRRGPQWRNGGTPEAFPSSHAKLHQLLLEERIETGANDPERRVKLKKRPLDGFKREDRLKSYMQKFMDTYSSDTKAVREISLDLVPMDFEFNNDSCQSGLEIVEIDTVSPREPLYRDKAAYSSFHIPEVVKSPVNELNEVTDGQTVEIPEANYGADADSFSLFIKDVTGEELAADTGSKSGGSVGEYNVDDVASEIDNYVDALATMESETETDSDFKTKSDQQYLDSMEKMIDSNGSEEKQQKNHFLDYHSVGNSTLSDDGTLLKKDVDGYSCSDNVSNTVEDTIVDGTVQSVIREAQGNIVEEFIVYDDAESMGRNLLFKAEFTELPWISVNAASKKIGKEGMEQTDPDSNRQAVVHSVPNSGYDHLMSVGISPVDEMADASSESSSAVSLGHSRLPEETSSHPQSEQARGGQSNLSRETTNSPVGNPINDLGQPVKATSEGLTLLQKSSVSLFNYPEPVYVSCEDNDSTLITEEKSEDQPRLSGVVPDHGLNGQIVGAPDVSPPNQLDFSEKDLQCLGKEANIQRVSMSDDNPELMDPMISVAADTDEIVEPRVSTAASSEDSSAPVVDHADCESPAAEIHCPLEVKPLFFGDSESAIRHEFDSSENVDAHSVDQSNYQKVHEPTDDETNINGDDSSSSDPVLSPSQLHSESGQVPKIPDATVELSDDQIAGAGISTAATIANMEGVFKSASADKVVSGLSLHAVGNHDDCLAMYQYQSGPAPIRSSDLVYDADEPVQAEGDTNSIDDISHDKDAAVSSPTISDDSCSEDVPEEEDDFDLNRSVQVLDHAETEGARHNCLKVEYTEAQMQSVSSVPDCSSMWFKESLSVNNVPETCLPKFSQTSLYPFCPEESSTSSVECDQQLEKTNSSRYDMVEDKVHVLDALSNAHTKMQIALDKAVEQRGVEITAESFNAMEGSSQPLEFVEQTLPPEDGGNEMYINPISVSSLSAPLSQPLAADISAQSGDYKVESRFVEEEPSALSVSVPHPRGPLDSEVSAQSADHELQSTWQTMEQPSTDFSSISLVPVGAQAGLKLENSGQTKDLSQASLPLFESFPNPDHNIAGEMPPLPPLPPIQWRLGRNQHPFGTMHGLMQPETSDNAGLRSENSSRAQHLNPFLPFSDLGAKFEHAAGYSGGSVQQPTDFVFPLASMSHEDGQQHTLTVDQSQGVHLIPGSQSDMPVPASDTLMGKFSFEPLESGLMTDHSAARPALSEDVLKTETAVPHEQFGPIFPPEEQERAVVDERQLERDVEHKIATTSAQFEPSVEMQYRHQLSHGFLAPEAQGIWSTDVFGARKPEHINGSLQKKIQRPRNPLIDAVVAVDKSKLRKVGEMVKPQEKPETEKREQHLPQLRKVGERVKPQGKPEPEKREQHIPQLRKVGKRVKPQDEVKADESFQNFPSLRKIGERVKPQDSSSAEDSIPHVLQLRKVGERIKPQDEPKADEEKQSLPPLRGVGKLKSQDGPQADKDWLEQIRNQSFNLKPAATTRPSIQGRQTNLKVAAILEKASMIRQAMAGNDEDDSDGWSDS